MDVPWAIAYIAQLLTIMNVCLVYFIADSDTCIKTEMNFSTKTILHITAYMYLYYEFKTGTSMVTQSSNFVLPYTHICFNKYICKLRF